MNVAPSEDEVTAGWGWHAPRINHVIGHALMGRGRMAIYEQPESREEISRSVRLGPLNIAGNRREGADQNGPVDL